MAKTPAKKSSHTGKILLLVLVVFVVGLVGFGYFSQTSNLQSSSQASETAAAPSEPTPMAAIDDPVYIAGPNDLVIGKTEAPITILDYSSLSCSHCAQFHTQLLPVVKTQLLDTGKAKLVYRHFPLNEPALRAAQVVECSGVMRREAMVTALFATQTTWAFDENFKDKLKTVAAQGGLDAAAFDSCLADKSLEDAILKTRQDAETKLHVDGTPAFYVGQTHIKKFADGNDFVKQVLDAAQATPAAASPVTTPETPKQAEAPAPSQP